jgi:two-component sensor histidine kinase
MLRELKVEMPSAVYQEPSPRAEAAGRMEYPGGGITKKPSERARIPAAAHLNAALQGARICIFSQDRDLRYSWLSGPLCGIPLADILNRTDDDFAETFDHAAATAAKRQVLETGNAADTEFTCVTAAGRAIFGLHIEPVRADDGTIQGITCIAQEITGRKEREAHLHTLMREITHRSKNLLAVIQGMARQTARHTGSIDNFLQLFSARLQALAQSHDLLVRQSWHSAALGDLVRGQLGHYLDRGNGQIEMDGPAVLLCPEAAQTVGLALHELAANAAKFGSLARPDGKVSVMWRHSGNAVEIFWTESGGPPVAARRQSGFGSLVLEKNLPRALDASVVMDFKPEGLHCRITVPERHLAKPDRPEHFPVTPR